MNTPRQMPTLGTRDPIMLVVITGMSGSGKSTALRALEDIGFFCIDNLPLVLLPKLVELFPATQQEIERVALVVDAREGRFLEGIEAQLSQVRRSCGRVEVLFLDSMDKRLLQRYAETRRRHPLAPAGRPEEGVALERQVLEPLRRLADEILDTSDLNPHQLRALLQQRYTRPPVGQQLPLWLVSFGFKHGLPVGAHLVFDARFLRNPYFEPQLREHDGRQQEVAAYVLSDPDCEALLGEIERFLKRFRPAYAREGKSHLTCAVGCTGGRHRSVVVVEELARRLAGPVQVHHRELEGYQ